MKKRMTQRTRNTLVGYLFVLPWIVGSVIFTFWPMFHALYLSFHEVRVTPRGIRTTFVGLHNYRHAFLSDVQFVEKLLVYLGEILLNVPVIIVFALIIALLINRKFKGQGIFRTIFFLPVVILSGPVMAELIDMGATSIPNIEKYALFTLVQENVTSVLEEPITYLFSQIIMVLWLSGVQILIFLAGLQKIDGSIMEAARVDGASGWEAFWKITLPAIQPMIVVNVVYTVVSISTFSLNGIIRLIQSNMFSQSTGYGYSTALAWLHFGIISLLLLGSTGILRVREG